MESQIKDVYYKAFFDAIDETINSKEPDFEWITRLYNEIKIIPCYNFREFYIIK